MSTKPRLDEINSMTVAALRQVCRDMRIEGCSVLRKDVLINVVRENVILRDIDAAIAEMAARLTIVTQGAA